MPPANENDALQLGGPSSRQISLRGTKSSVSIARQFVRRTLGTAHPSVDDAALVARHDMGDPVAAAARARHALTPDGTLLAVEPYASDRLEDRIGNPIAMSYYTASTFLCVPNSLSQDSGLALGAQAGESRMIKLLGDAGFSRVRLALTTDYNLVFEAKP